MNDIVNRSTVQVEPESIAVDIWVNRVGLDISPVELLTLKESVSRYRISVQKKLEIEKLKRLSWWRKDKHGWPIELSYGRPFSNTVRLIIQNLRKI